MSFEPYTPRSQGDYHRSVPRVRAQVDKSGRTRFYFSISVTEWLAPTPKTDRYGGGFCLKLHMGINRDSQQILFTRAEDVSETPDTITVRGLGSARRPSAGYVTLPNFQADYEMTSGGYPVKLLEHDGVRGILFPTVLGATLE